MSMYRSVRDITENDHDGLLGKRFFVMRSFVCGFTNRFIEKECEGFVASFRKDVISYARENSTRYDEAEYLVFLSILKEPKSTEAISMKLQNQAKYGSLFTRTHTSLKIFKEKIFVIR